MTAAGPAPHAFAIQDEDDLCATCRGLESDPIHRPEAWVAARGMTKRQAVLIASAAQRIQSATAELYVATAHLRARKVGTSPPEYYDLNRLILELENVHKRLRAKLGEAS